LESLVKTKEHLLNSNLVIYDQELTKLKFELATLKSENSLLKAQESTLTRDVLDLNDPAINQALLQKNGIDKALAVLSEEALDQEEINLAKAKLLHAKLLTAKGDFAAAAVAYEQTFKLRPCTNVAMAYISFLYFYKLDFEKVIEITSYTLVLEQQPALKGDLMAQQAQALLKLDRHEDARLLLTEAKKLIEDNHPGEMWAIAKTGRLDKQIEVDTVNIFPPEAVNGIPLTKKQKENYRRGKEVETEDGTTIQYSAKDKQAIRADRLALIASVLIDGGVSYILFKGLNALFNRKQEAAPGRNFQKALEKMHEAEARQTAPAVNAEPGEDEDISESISR